MPTSPAPLRFRFWDLYGGGYAKVDAPYRDIVITAASRDDAVTQFTAATGVDPEARTCHCCGSDFDISQED